MPGDVEQQLAALGRFWNKTIADVEASEIVSHGTPRSNPSVNGVNGVAAAPSPRRPHGIDPRTNGEATMIDLQISSPTDEHRNRPTRVLLAGLLAAAAVIAIVVVAIRDDEPASPADQPSTGVTVPGTTPQALFHRDLAPGTYHLGEVEETPIARILVTVGDGWGTIAPWAITKGVGQMLTFSRPERVFLDACHPFEGDHPGPLDTLDGLVTALIEQRGWAEVTTPTAISVDGYAGKAFQRTVPTDLRPCDGVFASWQGRLRLSDYPPGDTLTVWVLDLRGTIVVLESRVNLGQPAEAHEELAAILDSIRIVPE